MKRVALVLASPLGAIAACPQLVFAHSRQSLATQELWRAWTFEPLVVVLLALSFGLYALGIARVWSAAQPGAGVRRWRAASFTIGWLALAVALLSPLHALGAVLFSAHMTQHELLISVAAPLLVLGRPLVAYVWAIPPSWRKKTGAWSHTPGFAAAWRTLTLPSVAFGLHAIALWGWHLPGPYQATLTSELAHSLQHASFIFTALLFWWTILGTRGGELARGKSVLYLFATALSTGALGALLTFAPTLWYPAYAATTAAWGLSPIDDQQLGGLIMWIPGSLAYLVAALAIFAEWLRESERRSNLRRKSMPYPRALPPPVRS
jgi:cytochrome c oxidase assembly factor CtaG